MGSTTRDVLQVMPVSRPLREPRGGSCYLQGMAGAEVTIPVALPSAAPAREPAAVIERRLRLLWALDEIRAGRTTRVRAAAWLRLSASSKGRLRSVDSRQDRRALRPAARGPLGRAIRPTFSPSKLRTPEKR